jgi:hypothetical protein
VLFQGWHGPSEFRARSDIHAASPGCRVRWGRRQSIASSSIDSCALLSDTGPLLACSHTKRLRWSRLAALRDRPEGRHSRNDTGVED